MQLSKLAFVMMSGLAIRSAAAEPTSTEGASTDGAHGVSTHGAPADGASQSVLPGVLSTAAGATFDGRVDYSDSRFPTLLALNLHGQYITPSGFGGYLSLPFAYTSADLESQTFVGNPELGGLYTTRRGIVEAYARGGLALSPGEGRGLSDFMAPSANIIPRPADALTTGMDASFLRMGGGARMKSGALVVGVAGGADVEVGSDRGSNVAHVTTSVGIEQPRFGVAAGITFLQSLEAERGDGNLFGFQGTADVAINRKTRLYGAAGVNLESLAEDQPAFSVGLGVRIRL